MATSCFCKSKRLVKKRRGGSDNFEILEEPWFKFEYTKSEKHLILSGMRSTYRDY